jgi:hypothetical protein
MPKHKPSSGPKRQGADYLDDVYVNGTTGNDSYDGSSPTFLGGIAGPKKTIQEGINCVNYFGTVHVAAGTYYENIIIDISLSLEGAGARETIIDGSFLDTVVIIDAADELIDISGFTIRNGYGEWAGGIENGYDCDLFILQCAIVNNSGAVAGGIFNEECYITIGQCLIANNIAGEVGGGILNYDAWMFMVESTVTGNSLAPGGHEGGGIYGEYALNYVIDVTLAFNSATGLPDSAGGGFETDDCDWLIINTIVAHNRASMAGTNNAYYYPSDNDVFDAFCIDSENSCRFDGPNSQVNTDPRLGALAHNGGPTDTHAIGIDSAAFDRGSTFFFTAMDQRGVARPQGIAPDVGAFELALSPSGSTNSAGSGRELVSFSCDQGGIVDLVGLPGTACSGTLPPGMILPYGLFSFKIVSIPVGAAVRVTIRFPRVVPSNFQYWKCSGTGTWVNVTSLVMHNPGDNYVVLTLTDGGPGDADGVANGRIVDPGALALPINGQQPQSHSAYIAPPQQPVRLPNLSVQSVALSATSVMPGEPVTVTATVANRGTVNGAMKLYLTVNGEEEAVEGVVVNSGATAPVSFTVSRNEPGAYSVYAGGTYAGEFTVSQSVDPNLILFISSTLLCAAFVLGMVMIYRRQRDEY